MRLKGHFRQALEAAPGRLHFAAHSHHLWPDVTLEAQRQCWLDAARLADRKWDRVFGEVVPEAQGHVARVLALDDPTSVAFGPNTHGFLMRLLSCLPPGRPLAILASDGEFHSFSRQTARLEEAGLARVTRVACAPFTDFPARFQAAAAAGGHDLIYFSHVFFDPGTAVPDLAALVGAVPDPEAFVVIDGYHGFMALPTDLSALAGRAFYLAGGYKYAMAGEGAAFLVAPPGYGARPRDSGWFADFGALEAKGGGRVCYGTDASRFLGATFDPVGIYRLNAAMGLLADLGISVADVHAHVLRLQRLFIERLAALALEHLTPDQVQGTVAAPARGHFLTFRTPRAGDLHRRLLEAEVITDFRGDGLRFGFAVYHEDDDVERLCARLGKCLS